jgi:hypothetical protein
MSQLLTRRTPHRQAAYDLLPGPIDQGLPDLDRPHQVPANRRIGEGVAYVDLVIMGVQRRSDHAEPGLRGRTGRSRRRRPVAERTTGEAPQHDHAGQADQDHHAASTAAEVDGVLGVVWTYKGCDPSNVTVHPGESPAPRGAVWAWAPAGFAVGADLAPRHPDPWAHGEERDAAVARGHVDGVVEAAVPPFGRAAGSIWLCVGVGGLRGLQHLNRPCPGWPSRRAAMDRLDGREDWPTSTATGSASPRLAGGRSPGHRVARRGCR